MFNKDKPVEVKIDAEKCSKCGLCIEVCSGYLEKNSEGTPVARKIEDTLIGCVQCGHCMMACPSAAIEVIGEDIDKNHMRELSASPADYDSVNALLLKRRSVRRYKNQEIPSDLVYKIIDSSATAAVSIPPSEVKVLVIKGREKVHEFAEDIINDLRAMQKKANPIVLTLLRAFAGKSTHKMFTDFIIPLCAEIISKWDDGEDILFFDAPVVMVFYSSELSDKEDSLLAAANAVIAAESLGLGTCYIGTCAAALQFGKKLRKKYGIKSTDKIGTSFVLGYPALKFYRTMQRKFAEVKIVE